MRTHQQSELTVFSLFTGVGGLDLGLEAAGFRVVGCVERDEDARRVAQGLRPDWQYVEERDACAVDEVAIAKAGLAEREVTVLSGGPPCQPFSRAAAWKRAPKGLADHRATTLDAYFRIARTVNPRILLLENVPGFVSSPGVEEKLDSELDVLNEALGTSFRFTTLNVQAADYGVPQRRRRVFLLAHRDGLDAELPPSTHSDHPTTCWDAMGHLDSESWPKELNCRGKWAELLTSIPEGKNYCHHTEKGEGVPLFGWRTRFWSFLLKLAKAAPAWTLQATPGPSTGPFHWRSRSLSMMELAALQTMPVDAAPDCSLRVWRRLVGNAVPSAIGELMGRIVRRQFLGHDVDYTLSLVPRHRTDCPEPIGTLPVTGPYLDMVGEHAAHPGPGLGPGAQREVTAPS